MGPLYVYIRERRVGLSVDRDDPDASIDTNYLERALRVTRMGKKNWLFSRTELATRRHRAELVGFLQAA